MTKLPHADWNVQGVEGPKYKVGPTCAVATCTHYADHGHHIWRRSFLAGDYQWVELWDGKVVQNLCGLCSECHEKITLNKAWIAYSDDHSDGIFEYVDGVDAAATVLVPQPKTLASFATAMQMTIDGKEIPHDDVVRVPEEEPPCPTCGRKKKRVELPAGEKRNRASWSVSVPKDAREDGADVLDTLELECAKKLGRDDHASHKYYTLTEVMVDWLMSTATVADFGIGGVARGIDEDDGA
jgi:hypothetical protein